MMVPILAATAGLEGWFQFLPSEERGAAIIVVRFRRAGHADIVSRYGAVFIFDLIDGLMARGDAEAAYAAGRAAVRALELKHAARRMAEAARSLDAQQGQAPVGVEFPSVEGAGHSPSAVTPAGAGLPDLPPAGGPIPGAAR